MKKMIIGLALFASLVSPSFAVSKLQIKGDYPVCISSDAFERLQAILQHKDEAAFKKIMTTECFMPQEGITVDKVVSRGWTNGVSHIKVYHDGRLHDLWTNTKNVGSPTTK